MSAMQHNAQAQFCHITMVHGYQQYSITHRTGVIDIYVFVPSEPISCYITIMDIYSVGDEDI